MTVAFDERARASYIAALEERGFQVRAATVYVQHGMEPDYVREWPDASDSWAGQLIREARGYNNTLEPAELEALDSALAQGGLPGEPNWFADYGELIKSANPRDTGGGGYQGRW